MPSPGKILTGDWKLEESGWFPPDAGGIKWHKVVQLKAEATRRPVPTQKSLCSLAPLPHTGVGQNNMLIWPKT